MNECIYLRGEEADELVQEIDTETICNNEPPIEEINAIEIHQQTDQES